MFLTSNISKKDKAHTYHEDQEVGEQLEAKVSAMVFRSSWWWHFQSVTGKTSKLRYKSSFQEQEKAGSNE